MFCIWFEIRNCLSFLAHSEVQPGIYNVKNVTLYILILLVILAFLFHKNQTMCNMLSTHSFIRYNKISYIYYWIIACNFILFRFLITYFIYFINVKTILYHYSCKFWNQNKKASQLIGDINLRYMFVWIAVRLIKTLFYNSI